MKKLLLIAVIAVVVIAGTAKAQTEQKTILVTDNINTLEELVKPLNGRKIYIDIWATWCSPCLAQFAYNDALKKNLSENNVQQLYISIDNALDDEKWKNYIEKYNLTGTHIRANGKLKEDLFKRGLIIEGIPQYILIDEKGNIMNEHAKHPSQLVSGEKLY